MQISPFLTLVINLDRSPQRLATTAEQLDGLGIPWERLPAAEGRLFSLEDTELVDLPEFGRRHGKTPLHGELGCYLSHVWAMQRFLQTDCPYALILEDDVQISSRLPEVLKALAASAADWDMVKLSGVHSGTPVKLKSLGGDSYLAVTLTPYTGSSAYVINRHAAQKFADGVLPMRVPYDHEFDRGWHWKLKIRTAMPSACGHDQSGESMINTTAVNRKFHWTKRLPALSWRLHNQWCRLVYGGKAWFESRLN